MSSPDQIDERFDELVRELRSGARGVAAGPELRERVRAIAERAPEPPPLQAASRARSFSWPRRRRLAWAVVPVAGIVAAAIGVGVFSDSGGKQRQTERITGPAFSPARAMPALPPRAASTDQAFSSPLPPSGSRHQLYSVEMELRVKSLSGGTKQALNLTRSFGGYVRSVDYGSGTKSGTADLVLRIPIGKVQKAVVKLSALGTILDQHVSIQDIQPQLDRRFRELQALRVKIADLKAKLAATGLTDEQKAALQAVLVRRQAQLATLQHAQKQALTGASFATVSLYLETKKAAAVVPGKPSRFGQALHDIGRVLAKEGVVLLYVLLIGAPFFLLAALLWAGRRTLRRRADEHLLAR